MIQSHNQNALADRLRRRMEERGRGKKEGYIEVWKQGGREGVKNRWMS